MRDCQIWSKSKPILAFFGWVTSVALSVPANEPVQIAAGVFIGVVIKDGQGPYQRLVNHAVMCAVSRVSLSLGSCRLGIQESTCAGHLWSD
ncbi:hypothetical protein [Pseudoalteromonas sp. MMG022]|uniref:hypothetical protein n=1 Tax=Pseudoalteromonas sp. MMG022 TaxID=2909978 RepID=UPI001F327CBA|nr:hypothetical protein [Pseudoalteromonas sp. MMG022]MCF6435765.1 hypothetical protein [Pseudoalteromonas sp. MMG022]